MDKRQATRISVRLESADSLKEEIGKGADAQADPHPGISDAQALEALVNFERNPLGAVHWLGPQQNRQPRHLSDRWVAVIRAEAHLLLPKAKTPLIVEVAAPVADNHDAIENKTTA